MSATSACSGTATSGSSSSASGMRWRPGMALERPSTSQCSVRSARPRSTPTGGDPIGGGRAGLARCRPAGPVCEEQAMTTLIRGHRRLGAITAVTLPLLAAAAALVGAPDLHAADPFVAGGRSTRPVVTRPGENRRAEARGHSVAVALGLRSTREVAERLDDRFDHRTYDEVTSFDAGGRAIAVTRLGLDGAVQMTTILGWHGSTGRAIDAESATRVARAAATRLGLLATGPADVRSSAGAGGWSVTWPRIVDGAL